MAAVVCDVDECWYQSNPDRVDEFKGGVKIVVQSGLFDAIEVTLCDVCMYNYKSDASGYCCVCTHAIHGDQHLKNSRVHLCAVCISTLDYWPRTWIEHNYALYTQLVQEYLYANPLRKEELLPWEDTAPENLSSLTFEKAATRYTFAELLSHTFLSLAAWIDVGDEVQLHDTEWVLELFEDEMLDAYCDELRKLRAELEVQRKKNKRKRHQTTYEEVHKWMPDLDMREFVELRTNEVVGDHEKPFETAASVLRWCMQRSKQAK